MRSQRLLLLCAIVFATTCSQAQFFTVVQDDFESYTVGGTLADQSSNWLTWFADPTQDALVSDDVAFSGSKSIKIDELAPVQPTDIVLPIGPHTTGSFGVFWEMYVPSESGGYFNLLQSWDQTGFNNTWSLEVYLSSNGNITWMQNGITSAPVAFNHDTWFQVEVSVDLNNDLCLLHFNGVLVDTFQWSNQASGGAGLNQLAAVDFYGTATDGSNPGLYYVDDVFVEVSNLEGCTYPNACNYLDYVGVENGTCLFEGVACDDEDSETIDDTIDANCECTGTPAVYGCTIPEACVYDPNANVETPFACVGPATTAFWLDGSGFFCVEEGESALVTLNLAFISENSATEIKWLIASSGMVIDILDLTPEPDDTEDFLLPPGEYEIYQYALNGFYYAGIVPETGGQMACYAAIGEPCFVLAPPVNIEVQGPGCDDPVALNYNPGSCLPGPCEYGGCTDWLACNYDPLATVNDGTCISIGAICFDGDEFTYDDRIQPDCSCAGTPHVFGCDDPNSCFYDPAATLDDGFSCLTPFNDEIELISNPDACVGDGVDASFTFTISSISENGASDKVWYITDLDGIVTHVQPWSSYYPGIEAVLIDQPGDFLIYQAAYNDFYHDGPIPGIGDPVGLLDNAFACTAIDGPVPVTVSGPGCTDFSAVNYSPYACIDNGSCFFDCQADIDQSGFVDTLDLLALLSGFGTPCP